MVSSTMTPPEPVLRWAADQMGMGASVIAVQGLKDGAHPWLLRIRHAGQMTQSVLRLSDPDHPEWRHGGRRARPGQGPQPGCPATARRRPCGPAGMPTVLITVLPGTSRIPAVAPTERLRALGAAAAA